jgi:putative copper resistance protein D
MDMDESINGWFAAARGVHLAACMLLLGVWIFDRWIVGATAQQRAGPVAQSSQRIGRWLLAISFPAALLSGVAWFYFVADGMKDPDEPMRLSLLGLVWTGTQFGRVWQLRSILWILVAIFLSPPLVFRGRVREGARRAADWLAGTVAAAFVASLAWAGHGATGPAPGWHRVEDVVHLLVCAAWPIGLLPLGLLLWQFAGTKRPIPTADIAGIVRRFSAMALGAVVVLIGTGTLNAWCLVGSFPALWITPYGRVLLLKLAIFLAVVALGAVNLLLGKPQLLRIEGGQTGSLPIIRRMMWIVAIEAVLAFGIIAVVGVLGLLMPARM